MFTPNYLVLMASHRGMSLSQALPAEEVTIATVNTVRHLTFFFHSHHLYKERFINKKDGRTNLGIWQSNGPLTSGSRAPFDDSISLHEVVYIKL